MYQILNKIYSEYPYHESIKVTDDKKENIYRKGLNVFEVDGLPIPLNPDWKKIAVNMSGGADSCCLIFCLANLIEKNNLDIQLDVITHVRCWETRPWAGPISLEVFEKLKSLYPNIVKDRYTNFIPPVLEYGANGEILDGQSGDMIIVDHFNNYLAYVNQYDAVYNSTTANPPIDSVNLQQAPNRDNNMHNVIFKNLATIRNYSYWFLKPFLPITKDWVIKQYKDNNYTDLLHTTRSCEGEWDHLNYQTYKVGQEIPECGKCYWCLERQWAVDKVYGEQL